MEVSGDRVVEELERRSALLGAGGDDGPDSLAPLSATFAAGPLSDAAIDDHKTHGLFREVVGRLDARCGDEAEIGIAVKTKTLG